MTEVGSVPDRPASPASNSSASNSFVSNSRGSSYHRFFLRLHFYAGVFIGPFLLVATLTGGLYAIAPTIEQIVHRDQLHSAHQGELRPVAEQIRAAEQVVPDLPVTAVRPAAEAGETTRVMFNDPTLGSSERHAVFVDPVTATTQGELTVYGNAGALPVRTWIDRLHRDLHLGDPGRLYSELAASWLWLIAVAGVVLWVMRVRRLSRRDGSTARLLTVDRTSRGRIRTLNWHGVVGIWIAVGLLFLSATGLTWSRYAGDNITDLRAALSWTTPTVATALDRSGQHEGHHGAGPDFGPDVASAAGSGPRVDEVDRVLEAARTAGVDGRVEVTIPTDPATAFTVTETRQPFVMSNNSAAVDGATGQVTDILWHADWPLAAKLSAWGIQLHMGLLFGLANQLVLLVLAAALATVIVRGYLLWWRRRPTRGGPPVGRPPRRGVLADLPLRAVLGVVVAAIAIGWFVPLFGLSLLAFLAVDIALGQRTNRRDQPGTRPAGETAGLPDGS